MDERSKNLLGTLGLLAMVLTVAATDVRASSQAASAALRHCHRAELVEPELAGDLIETGIHEAEAAVTDDPDDPVAHFALFCNLAKRTRMRRFSITALGDLRRLHRALDRSLDLDPDYADAIAAKGALLYYSPRFAGGDVAAAERLLRHALAIDPRNPARLVLVDLLTYCGRLDEARRQAAISVALIRPAYEERMRAGARAVLSYMCDERSRPDRDRRVLEVVC